MIDIRFLNVIPEIRLRSGLEFLDWQDLNFYNELSQFFKKATRESLDLNLDRTNRETLAKIIKKHSNVSVNVQPVDWGNAAIDTGFISPNSVANIEGLDGWLHPSRTKTADAFKRFKKDVLNGWCDLKTGKVEGDFKNIEFNLLIAGDLPFEANKNKDRFPKGIQLENVLASIILHEIGHAFFNLHAVSSAIIDNALGLAAAKMLTNEPDKNRRAVIIKEIAQVSEVDLSALMRTDEVTPDVVMIIFDKGLRDRNTRRTLSLGVSEMNSEVLADAYAIRMGGSRGLTGFLSKPASYRPAFSMLLISTLMLLTPFTFVLGALGILIGVGAVSTVLNRSMVSTIYDTPYRRIKNILRENIQYLNSRPKGYSGAQLAQLKSDALEMDKLVESTKSFWESTWLQRWLGFAESGRDFRKSDFEHYTADLSSSRLALYTEMK